MVMFREFLMKKMTGQKFSNVRDDVTAVKVQGVRLLAEFSPPHRAAGGVELFAHWR
jgi:hypothetical protein